MIDRRRARPSTDEASSDEHHPALPPRGPAGVAAGRRHQPLPGRRDALREGHPHPPRGRRAGLPGGDRLLCDLNPAQKGVHMSRFEEDGERGDRRGRDRRGAASSRRSPSASPPRSSQSQRALRSEVTIRASYPVEKRTPVTDIPTQEMYEPDRHRGGEHRTSRRVVGVTAQGMNACPCAQGLIRPRPRRPCARTGSPRTSRAHRRPRPDRDPQPARARDPLPRRPRRARRRRRRADRDRRGGHVLGDLRAAQAPRRAVRGDRAHRARASWRTRCARWCAACSSGSRTCRTTPSSTPTRSTSRPSTPTTSRPSARGRSGRSGAS